MSVIELMGVVAGVALALALWPEEPRNAWFPSFGDARWTIPVRATFAGIALIPVALTPILIAQRARRGDMTRPAEWLLLAMAAIRIVRGLESWDGAIFWPLLERSGGYFRVGGLLIQWSTAGLATLAAFAGLALFVVVRRSLGPASRTLAIFLLAIVSLWGPIKGFENAATGILWSAYAERFGPFVGPMREALQSVASVPSDLFIVVPIIAYLASRSRSGAVRWTEAAGLILAFAFAAMWLADRVMALLFIGRTGGPRAVLESVLALPATGAGLLIAIPLAWWMVGRYGARWDGTPS